MFSLKQLQEEHKPWVLHNFGPAPAHWPLQGITEEFGELSNAMSTADIEDALADIMIFSVHYCSLKEWDVETLWQNAKLVSLIHDVEVDTLSLRVLGRLHHHDLKAAQKIRLSENHDESGRVLMAEMFAIVQYIAKANTHPIDVMKAVEETWNKVKLRDFKKNNSTGEVAGG